MMSSDSDGDSMIIDDASSSSADDDSIAVIGYQAPDVDCHLADDNTLFRLSANDPAIAGLFLETTYDKAERVGVAIGKNTHLQQVEICNLDAGNQYLSGTPKITALLESLCKSLANNRSIEHLKIKHFDHSHVDIFPILAPFFEHNLNLRCIDVSQSQNFSERIPSLISTLLQSERIQLERIDMWFNDIGDVQAANLFNTLNIMPGLPKLLDLHFGFNGIGIGGCKSLGELLKNPASRIQHLNLLGNDIDDRCIEILVQGLVMNNTIKRLDLGSQLYVTQSGWCTFSAYFSNPICSLEEISLSSNKIGNEGATSLGEFMAVNNSLKLKSIDISSSELVSSEGWQGFSRCLTAPNYMLEKLDISMCNIDDQGALAIVSALIHLTNFEALNMSSNRLVTAAGWMSCFRLLLDSEFSLKELILNCNSIDDEGAELLVNSLAHTPLKTWKMEGNEAVTAAGWIACFRILIDSESSWANFSLGGNSIDDEGVAMLVSLLASTSTVTSLELSSNASITTHGWRAFADVLRPTSSSKLRELRIGTYEQAAINDDVIVLIASAIRNNTSLELFDVYDDSEISIVGWSALARSLCDNSSISNICYNSNHSLHTIYDDTGYYDDLPCGGLISSLLEMNSTSNKSEVVRAKILRFFDVDAIGSVFANATESILPSVFGWIGKDCLGFSLMYSFVQCNPSMFKV